MFTVFDAVLLRPLPVRDPDGIVVLWTHQDSAVELSIQRSTMEQVRAESRTMREIAMDPSVPGDVQMLVVARVAPNANSSAAREELLGCANGLVHAIASVAAPAVLRRAPVAVANQPSS